MTLDKGSVLNNSFIIKEQLKKQTNYYLYSATEAATGQEVFISEYYPPEATRGENGSINVPDSYEELFDICTNNIMTDTDIVSGLELNNYLMIKTSFFENDTVYVVSEAFKGATLKEYMDGINRPLTLQEAMPIFLDLLHAVENAAQNSSIYFHISYESIYVMEDGTLRLNCFYANNYEERLAVKDMANLLFYMLTNSLLDIRSVDIKTSGLSRRHERLVQALRSELREADISSVSEFYNTMFFLFHGKRKRGSNTKGQKLNASVIVTAVVIVLILIMSVVSYYVLHFMGKPEDSKPKVTDDQKLPDEPIKKVFEFDIQ